MSAPAASIVKARRAAPAPFTAKSLLPFRAIASSPTREVAKGDPAMTDASPLPCGLKPAIDCETKFAAWSRVPSARLARGDDKPPEAMGDAAFGIKLPSAAMSKTMRAPDVSLAT